MSHRLTRFHQHQRRSIFSHALGWLAIAAVALVLAAFTVNCAAQTEAGLMLRPGEPAYGPTDGWYRVTHKDGALQVLAVAAPVSVPGEEEAEAIDTRYIRVPGARIAEGRLPTVAFPGGVLAPRADHAYRLALGDTPFTLTVGGEEEAVYTVQVGEDSYSYRLQGAEATDSVIVAAADLDSDSKPDFIVQTGDRELLLLSSRTHPGLNPPAAVLALNDDGC